MNYEPVDDKGQVLAGVYCNDSTKKEGGTYGRLYSWTVATGSVADECDGEGNCTPKSNVQGICPDGWLLPSHDEFDALVTAKINFYAKDGFNALNSVMNEGGSFDSEHSGFWSTWQINDIGQAKSFYADDKRFMLRILKRMTIQSVAFRMPKFRATSSSNPLV